MLPALVERLEQRDWQLASLVTRHASLDDVFVMLTGRQLQQAEEASIVSEHSNVPAARRYPFLSLIAARVREFRREPAAIFWVYVFPLILVVALGVAFRNKPVGGFTVAVEAGNRADPVRESWKATGGSGCPCATPRRAVRGCAPAVRNWSSPRRPARTKGTPTTSTPPRPTASWHAAWRTKSCSGPRDGRTPYPRSITRPTEPGGRYIDFLVPGLLGMGLLGGGMWGVGFAIVDMRMRKLLKRYLATPMKRSHFLAAVMASRLLFTIPEVLVVLLCARLLFGVTSQGSYSDARAADPVGGLRVLGHRPAGRQPGTDHRDRFRADERRDAADVDRLRDLLLHGAIPGGRSAGVCPLLPLTPLIHALRSVMLEGAGLLSLGPQLALILAWGAVTFSLALRWFRWN